MNTTELTQYIQTGELDATLERLYLTEINHAKKRYSNCIKDFCNHFGSDRQVSIFSAPGRTEVGGNHTDHQHGRVLAGAINLDIIAVASKNDTNTVNIQSIGFGLTTICVDDLSMRDDEKNSTQALVRGISSKMQSFGFKLHGFDASVTSNVLSGSGLSSSAAFEVLIATILNQLYCDNALSPIELAITSQYAENTYFGKPCGLMDQTASAVGGFIMIDFQNSLSPVVKQIDFDLNKHGYQLVIVNTGSNHADLTNDYASIPEEMKLIATYFKKNYLREVNVTDFNTAIPQLMLSVSHRAILRAIHFFNDNDRVMKQANALENDDITTFLIEVNASGLSSSEYLQNSYSIQNPDEQGISLALCMTKQFLHGKGACRVHGGGFAGTIQAYVPIELTRDYITLMENVFGVGCCYTLHIRKDGGIQVIS